MRGLDETDRKLLELLLEDSRLPYSDLADAVGLSPPAVSDRIDRLQDLGIITRFTVDIDQSKLRESQSMLVTITGTPGSASELKQALSSVDAVEHIFATVDDTVVCTIAVQQDVGALLRETLPLETVVDYSVSPLQGEQWTPALTERDMAIACAECGNRVSEEGEQERFDGELYHFCCSSCQARFRDQYERLQEGV